MYSGKLNFRLPLHLLYTFLVIDATNLCLQWRKIRFQALHKDYSINYSKLWCGRYLHFYFEKTMNNNLQTVIPIFMVYIPSSLILICPLFNINLGRISVVITVTMSIFTALDPLPNIFIIKNYKRATYRKHLEQFYFQICFFFRIALQSGMIQNSNKHSKFDFWFVIFALILRCIF